MNILITGGASGLGESITRRLAQNSNSTVYFTYNKSQESAEKIEKQFPNAVSIRCDFKKPNEINLLKDKINKYDINVLINNAYNGGFLKTYFHRTSSDDFLNNFKENLIPTIEVTQAAINCFRKKKQGKIITILTSSLVNSPPIGSSVYVAGKAYLEKLTKCWAVENAKFNITSNSVSPSFLETGFTKDMDERMVEQIKEKHPLKKVLTTEEVAETVFFLTHSSAQINGVDILMNSVTNIR